MKRIFMTKGTFLLGLASAVFLLSCQKKPSPESWFEFEVKNGTAIVVGITEEGKQEKKIVMPAEYKGFAVTKIGDFAFEGCSSLASVDIPPSVAYVAHDGNRLFGGCSSLKDIKVDAGNARYKSVGGILYDKSGARLIRCPEGKSGAVEIPSSVTEIDSGAFWGCLSLASVEIPSSVTKIGGSAFHSCSSLTSVKIPLSVTEIYGYAFDGCKSLASIEIPSSVTHIGRFPFHHCSSLEDISVDAGNTRYKSVDGILYECDENGMKLMECPNGKSGAVEIPSSVTEIDSGAFATCKFLTSVRIPSSVTSIGDSAFSFCFSLTSVRIPSSVTSIGDSAFSSCSSLTSVVYAGTMWQWMSIEKSSSWSFISSIEKVVCSDGTIWL